MDDDVQLKIWNFSPTISSENITTTTAEIPYTFTYEIDCPRDTFPALPGVGDTCVKREYSNQKLNTESPAYFSGLVTGAENKCVIDIEAGYDCTYKYYEYVREVISTATGIREDADHSPYEGWELVDKYTGEVEEEVVTGTKPETVQVFDGEFVELPADAEWSGEGVENGRHYTKYTYQVPVYEIVTNTYWFYDYELASYGWDNYDNETKYETIFVTAGIATVYTHPGTCSAFPNLADIEKPRPKATLINPNEVSNWLSHYEKWKAWDNQDTFTLSNPEDYSVIEKQQITADWYNRLASLVGFGDDKQVNSGDKIEASHFTSLNTAIS